MYLSLAEIRSSVSITKAGTFSAFVKKDNARRNIIYTSPFKQGVEGGFIGIPNKGQTIICCKSDKRDPWYYLSTVMMPPRGFGDGAEVSDCKSPLEEIDNRVYKARGVPQRTVWRSDGGNKIVLSDEYNPEYFNRKLELKSGIGKTIAMLDSPEQDYLVMRNEHHDGIKISSEKNQNMAAQSIEIESRGPQKIICREAQIDIWVTEGRELNIINDSTGLFKDPNDANKYGNVNIESSNRDVSIRTKSPSGRIFIQALGPNASMGADVAENAQLIVIRVAGVEKGDLQPTIQIISSGNLELSADKNITIQAQEDIKFIAGKSIQMNAPNWIDIDAGATGNVHLNSGFAAGLLFEPPATQQDHYYNRSVY